MDGKALDQWTGNVPLEEITINVDDIIENALVKGPEVALNYGAQLRGVGQLTSYRLAYLLWRLEQVWKSFPTDDDFEDAIFKSLGYSTDTTYRYVKIWDDIFANENVPKSAKIHLLGMPINTTYELCSPARHDKMTEEDWQNVIDASDVKQIKEIKKHALGKEEKPENKLVIMWEKDGRLRARKGQGKYEDFGFLPVETDSEVIKMAVDRIISSAGIVKKGL